MQKYIKRMFPHGPPFGKLSGFSSIAAYALFSGVYLVSGQQVNSERVDVTEVVRRARIQVTNYQKEFRNLLA